MKAHSHGTGTEIRELRAAEQDSVWIAENYERLRRKYDRQFIAVYRKRVVDHDRDGAKLAKRLRRKHPKNQPQMTVTYVTREEVDLIL